MADPIWQNLQKSLDDPETIEQAIARLITDHNNSPDSHLGAGQSLENHKTADIIDHPAGSVVVDKMFSAPFDYNSNFADYSDWQKNRSSFFSADLSVQISLYSPNVVGYMYRELLTGIEFLRKRLSFRFNIVVLNSTSDLLSNDRIEFGVGGFDDSDNGCLNFRIKSDGLYIHYMDDTVYDDHFVKVLDFFPEDGVAYNFCIDYDKVSNSVNYYLNGVLLYTLNYSTTPFTLDFDDTIRVVCNRVTNSASELYFKFTNPRILVDMY